MADSNHTVHIHLEVTTSELDIVDKLRQLNAGLTDGSQFVARVELNDQGLPLLTFFREPPGRRVPNFLRPSPVPLTYETKEAP